MKLSEKILEDIESNKCGCETCQKRSRIVTPVIDALVTALDQVDLDDREHMGLPEFIEAVLIMTSAMVEISPSNIEFVSCQALLLAEKFRSLNNHFSIRAAIEEGISDFVSKYLILNNTFPGFNNDDEGNTVH